MAGRRVALLCIDPWEEAGEFHPFNYAVRRVQAALVARGIEAHLVESTSTEVEPFLERLLTIEPDVVGASAYVWSFPTFVELSRRLKARRPEVVFVLGGPSARTVMLDLPPFRGFRAHIDALVEGEGEEAFAELAALASLGPDALSGLPGAVVPARDGWRRGPPASLPDLNRLPSPYALDLVPRGVSAHLETFRGCPLACSFCQWGDDTGSSRIFSAERIAEDLSHFRRLGLRDAVLVDAGLNLNARAFRALAEAERQTRVLRETQLSFEVYPSHLNDEHLAFLADIRVNSIGLGLQSYDQAVLRRLQRRFDPVRFERVARDLSTLGGQVTIEIILGLPGDGPESFRRTLERARALPCDVRVYHCLVLPDALMTRAPAWAAMDFDPVTLSMRSCAGWSERDLCAMRAELSAMAAASDGWDQGSFWFFPQDHRRGLSGPHVGKAQGEGRSLLIDERDAAFTRDAMAAVARATGGRWSVRSAERRPAGCSLTLDAEGSPLVVDLVPAAPGVPSFVVSGGVAVSYRTPPAPIQRAHLSALRAMAPALAALFGAAARGDAGRRGLPVLPT